MNINKNNVNISEYEYGNLKDIWNNGEYLEHLEHILCKIDMYYDNCDHKKLPYVYYHLLEMDCMFDCAQCFMSEYYNVKNEEAFWEGCDEMINRCKFTRKDLEWYFPPHMCNTYVLLIWKLLKCVYPDDDIDILLYSGHFVCLNRNKKLIYDMVNDNDKILVEEIKKKMSLYGNYTIDSSEVEYYMTKYNYELPFLYNNELL